MDYMQHSFVQTLSSFLYQNQKQNHLSFVALVTIKNKKPLFLCYLPEISFATNTEATRLNDRPTIQHLLLERSERNLSPRNRSLQLHFRRNCIEKQKRVSLRIKSHGEEARHVWLLTQRTSSVSFSPLERQLKRSFLPRTGRTRAQRPSLFDRRNCRVKTRQTVAGENPTAFQQPSFVFPRAAVIASVWSYLVYVNRLLGVGQSTLWFRLWDDGGFVYA